MKRTFFKTMLCSGLIFSSLSYSQDNTTTIEQIKKEKESLPKPYRPEDDAQEKINNLIAQAQKENKNIILQAGGNWCIWCLRFDNFVKTTPELKQLVDDNFLYYHLNYSKENKNEAIFAKYGNPGKKYGFPVFIVLDKTGKHIHTQSSEAFEDGDWYGVKKVANFFEKWKVKK